MDIIKNNFEQIERITHEFASSDENLSNIATAAAIMIDAIRNGGQVISCGNGGSLCDAAHFAEELTARFRRNRTALAAVAISDCAYITCVANDFGFDQTVSRYIEAFGKQGDVLLAISTSGNSQNIVCGAKKAIELGMKVVALTGKTGGKLASNCSIEIRAPHSEYSDRVQEIHIKVIHTLVQLIERGLDLDR